jgi:hypothetical protein
MLYVVLCSFYAMCGCYDMYCGVCRVVCMGLVFTPVCGCCVVVVWPSFGALLLLSVRLGLVFAPVCGCCVVVV